MAGIAEKKSAKKYQSIFFYKTSGSTPMPQMKNYLNKFRALFSYLSSLIFNISSYKNTGVYFSAGYALLILFLGLFFHKTGSYLITSENDFFSSYVPHAERLLRNNFVIDVFRGPLYVMVLAGGKLFIKNYLTTGIIISALSSGFFLFFTYSLIRKIFSASAAFAAVLLTAVNSTFVVYSYGPGTDMFFCALCAASIYFLFTAENYNTWNMVLSAFFAGLAFLTRYNAIFLVLAFPIFLFLVKTAGNSYKQSIIALIQFAVIFTLTVSPWGIYTYNKTGEVFYNENYRNVAISLGGYGKIDWEAAWYKNYEKYTSMSQIIKEQPGLLAKTTAYNFFYHAGRNFFGLNAFYTGIFILLGFIFFKRQKYFRGQLGYYITNILFFLLLLPCFYDARFSLFLIPCMMVLAYFGIKGVSGTMKIQWTTLFICLFAAGIIKSVSYNCEVITGQQEVKLMSHEFFSKYNIKGKRTVASRMPLVSYSLNMYWKLIPLKKSIDETIAELKKKNIDYLYFSQREYNERPGLRSLINPAKAPADLTPVIYLPNEPAVLYMVKKSPRKIKPQSILVQ